jgi:hypothetical protein
LWVKLNADCGYSLGEEAKVSRWCSIFRRFKDSFSQGTGVNHPELPTERLYRTYVIIAMKKDMVYPRVIPMKVLSIEF